MNSFIVFVAILAYANAGLIAAPAARILQGPSSRTTVVGPDGSAISAVAPGGQIITEEQPAVVAETAPIVAAAPALVRSSVLATGLAANTVVAGPSGTISTSEPLAAVPALAVAAPSLVARSALVATPWNAGLVAAPLATAW